MKQAVLLIDCYLYGTIAVLAVVLLVLVYLHGQANHLAMRFPPHTCRAAAHTAKAPPA